MHLTTVRHLAAAAVLTATAALPTALATTTAAAAPTAAINPSPRASVSPSTVAPGGRVSLNIEGCGTRTGRASSDAFGDVRLTSGNLESSNLFGSAQVLRNTTPGRHRVTFECGGAGGTQVTVFLQVTPGAARGGLGGSVDRTDLSDIAIGGALVATALATGIWALRRRAAHRP
ncbi:hypothetical protein ACM614_11815 [Streptomyces sp. 12297]|uniref:hypothetical protein n=1 Tax=Streptomyces sp. NBC_00239 TaxID=2903640 RepID=UPI002E29EAD8|nr:hypothetical protein [Streptomyces sp. NBC_00239]